MHNISIYNTTKVGPHNTRGKKKDKKKTTTKNIRDEKHSSNVQKSSMPTVRAVLQWPTNTEEIHTIQLTTNQRTVNQRSANQKTTKHTNMTSRERLPHFFQKQKTTTTLKRIVVVHALQAKTTKHQNKKQC